MLRRRSRTKPSVPMADNTTGQQLLQALQLAGFPPDELQAVRQTPDMWQQLLQF